MATLLQAAVAMKKGGPGGKEGEQEEGGGGALTEEGGRGGKVSQAAGLMEQLVYRFFTDRVHRYMTLTRCLVHSFGSS